MRESPGIYVFSLTHALWPGTSSDALFTNNDGVFAALETNHGHETHVNASQHTQTHAWHCQTAACTRVCVLRDASIYKAHHTVFIYNFVSVHAPIPSKMLFGIAFFEWLLYTRWMMRVNITRSSSPSPSAPLSLSLSTMIRMGMSIIYISWHSWSEWTGSVIFALCVFYIHWNCVYVTKFNSVWSLSMAIYHCNFYHVCIVHFLCTYIHPICALRSSHTSTSGGRFHTRAHRIFARNAAAVRSSIVTTFTMRKSIYIHRRSCDMYTCKRDISWKCLDIHSKRPRIHSGVMENDNNQQSRRLLEIATHKHQPEVIIIIQFPIDRNDSSEKLHHNTLSIIRRWFGAVEKPKPRLLFGQ